MQGQQIREFLHSGERTYGTHVCGPSNGLALGILAAAPLDFAFLCTEHMPLDRSEVSLLCQLFAAKGISPIVRIPYPSARQATMALDAGAQGIVAPYVETVEEVKEVVGAVRYRPIKGKLLQQFVKGTRKPSPATVEFLERFNRHSYTIIGIESVAAYEGLDALIAVEGVDGVFIGPHDMSVSLEEPEQWDHPELLRILEDIVVRCREARIGVGVHLTPGILPKDRVRRLMNAGMNWILYASDVGLARDALRSRFEELRKEYEDEYVPGAEQTPSASSCAALGKAEKHKTLSHR
jgi:2-keto-3-deoxy-L-rhamnonate aldolase RhmA